MELVDEFAQVKAEFAEKIAFGEERARNKRFDKLQKQHCIKKMTSDSGLEKRKKYSGSDKNCDLYGSSESLPSVFFVERGENWVCSDEFEELKMSKDNFDEKVYLSNDVKCESQESSELNRREYVWSKMESSQFQELEMEVTKLQAKINEVIK